MTDRHRAAALAIAAGRLAYGSLLVLAPRRMLRLQLGGDPSGALVFAARAFGARDAVLGAGVLLAPDDDARRGWVAAGVAADASDLVSSLFGAKRLGRARALAVGVTAAAASATGAWSLSSR